MGWALPSPKLSSLLVTAASVLGKSSSSWTLAARWLRASCSEEGSLGQLFKRLTWLQALQPGMTHSSEASLTTQPVLSILLLCFTAGPANTLRPPAERCLGVLCFRRPDPRPLCRPHPSQAWRASCLTLDPPRSFSLGASSHGGPAYAKLKVGTEWLCRHSCRSGGAAISPVHALYELEDEVCVASRLYDVQV